MFQHFLGYFADQLQATTSNRIFSTAKSSGYIFLYTTAIYPSFTDITAAKPTAATTATGIPKISHTISNTLALKKIKEK